MADVSWKNPCPHCGGPMPCACYDEFGRVPDDEAWDSQNWLAARIIVVLLIALLAVLALAPKYAPWLLRYPT